MPCVLARPLTRLKFLPGRELVAMLGLQLVVLCALSAAATALGHQQQIIVLHSLPRSLRQLGNADPVAVASGPAVPLPQLPGEALPPGLSAVKLSEGSVVVSLTLKNISKEEFVVKHQQTLESITAEITGTQPTYWRPQMDSVYRPGFQSDMQILDSTDSTTANGTIASATAGPASNTAAANTSSDYGWLNTSLPIDIQAMHRGSKNSSNSSIDASSNDGQEDPGAGYEPCEPASSTAPTEQQSSLPGNNSSQEKPDSNRGNDCNGNGCSSDINRSSENAMTDARSGSGTDTEGKKNNGNKETGAINCQNNENSNRKLQASRILVDAGAQSSLTVNAASSAQTRGKRRLLQQPTVEGLEEIEAQESQTPDLRVKLNLLTTAPHLVVYRLAVPPSTNATAALNCSTEYCSRLLAASIPVDTQSIQVTPDAGVILGSLGRAAATNGTSSAPQSVQAAASQQNPRTGAIVGGTIGGAVLLSLLLLFTYRAKGRYTTLSPRHIIRQLRRTASKQQQLPPADDWPNQTGGNKDSKDPAAGPSAATVAAVLSSVRSLNQAAPFHDSLATSEPQAPATSVSVPAPVPAPAHAAAPAGMDFFVRDLADRLSSTTTGAAATAAPGGPTSSTGMPPRSPNKPLSLLRAGLLSLKSTGGVGSNIQNDTAGNNNLSDSAMKQNLLNPPPALWVSELPVQLRRGASGRLDHTKQLVRSLSSDQHKPAAEKADDSSVCAADDDKSSDEITDTDSILHEMKGNFHSRHSSWGGRKSLGDSPSLKRRSSADFSWLFRALGNDNPWDLAGSTSLRRKSQTPPAYDTLEDVPVGADGIPFPHSHSFSELLGLDSPFPTIISRYGTPGIYGTPGTDPDFKKLQIDPNALNEALKQYTQEQTHRRQRSKSASVTPIGSPKHSPQPSRCNSNVIADKVVADLEATI